MKFTKQSLTHSGGKFITHIDRCVKNNQEKCFVKHKHDNIFIFCIRSFDFNSDLYSFFLDDSRVSSTTELPLTYLPPMNTTYIPASQPPGNSTVGILNSTETSMTTALSNTSSVPYNSSHVQEWTSSALYTTMSSTVQSPLPTTTCCKKYFIFISRLLEIPMT